jgi:hypothetical protein
MRPAQILMMTIPRLGIIWQTTMAVTGLGLDRIARSTRIGKQSFLSNPTGKLVLNPGGQETVAHPERSAGRRLAGRYPFYFDHNLTIAPKKAGDKPEFPNNSVLLPYPAR